MLRHGRALIALMLFAVAGGATAEVVDPALAAVLAGPQRSAASKARDVYRHPAGTLAFFGVKPDQTVVEMLPGEGWYTEILAPYLRDRGKLVAVGFPPDSPNEYMRKRRAEYAQKLAADPASYGKVEVRAMSAEQVDLGAPASADVVLNFRNTHNWIRRGQFDSAYKAIYTVLKPGGVLGIEQHRAAPDADPKVAAESGYVPEAWLIKELGRLGFEFAGKSEVNANPKDTRDHPKGVWTLPPSYALGATDHDKYAAIGESDRMTLKFVKPK
ncbi:MAG: class I SAM-dependent methyltransferase [Gammaproteobacteria bacterium]|nr:class I SAM-dependent methyltransferase [Gammaproteobacteria bacterium]